MLPAPAVTVLCRLPVWTDGSNGVVLPVRPLPSVSVRLNVGWIWVIKYGVCGVVDTTVKVWLVFVVVMVWLKALHDIPNTKKGVVGVMSGLILGPTVYWVVAWVRVKNALVLPSMPFSVYLFSLFILKAV